MNDDLTSLYSTWLNLLPQAFAQLAPANPGAGAANKAAPYPVDQIQRAMGGLDTMLTQLYQSYLPLLANGKLTAEPLKGLADSSAAAFNQMLAMSANPFAGLPPMMDGAHFGAGTNQLASGLERTFGGLAEAFGMGPARELKGAWGDMLTASAAKQRAQLEYLALVAQAFGKGTLALVQELQAMAGRGEHVDSLLAFIRLWAKAVDGPLHETMQGGPGLEVTAKVIRAASLHREQIQKTVALASTALHVPTRAEMDSAFKEIQELKRELRRLKKAPEVAPVPARAARTPAKKSTTGAKKGSRA